MAIACTMTLVGCSKGNKTEADAAGIPAAAVIQEDKVLDANGNVIGTIVEGEILDAKGNVIGTVDELQAKLGEIKDNVADGVSNAADSIKASAANAVNDAKAAAEGAVENAKAAAQGAVDNAKAAAQGAVDDAKAAAQQKANELITKGAADLQNQVNNLSK